MRKIIGLVILSMGLTGCMAANIVANVLPDAIDIGKILSAKEYKIYSSEAKFSYFDSEKGTVTAPERKYFKILSNTNEYIGFAVSEADANDSGDCLIGFRFYKNDVDVDINLLKQFLNWSEQNAHQAISEHIELKIDMKKTINLVFAIDKEKQNPLLIYSGKNCDFFAKPKYYAITPQNVKQIITEVKSWKESIEMYNQN